MGKKLTGSRAKGKRFEKRVGRELKRILGNRAADLLLMPARWIWFEDEGGPGWAQPDFFIVLPDSIALLECKLTQRASAWNQMADLYVPLLDWIFDRPVRQFQVCQNLRTPARLIKLESVLDETIESGTVHLLPDQF